MKRILTFILVLTLLFSLFACSKTGKTDAPTDIPDSPTTLFVSTYGDDSAAGTKDAPLATLDGARRKVRSLLNGTREPITVYFRGGDYLFPQGVTFDASDSGTEEAPVTYRAVPGEKVTFAGGVKVEPSRVSAAKDSSVVERIRDGNAKAALLKIDLAGLVDVFPDIWAYGHLENDSEHPMTVYLGDDPLIDARWPNLTDEDPYIRTSERAVVDNDGGTKTIFYGDDIAARLDTWSDESLEKLFMVGFNAYEYTTDSFDASLVDRSRKAITLLGSAFAYFEATKPSARVFFENLPEELDEPGECYTDRNALAVYFYPTENYDPDRIFVSTLTEDLITLNGASHLVFEDITFGYTRWNAMVADAADDILLKNCTLAHTSDYGARFMDSTRIHLDGCELFDTVHGGVLLDGGDRKTLTSSGCVVENCDIHEVSRTHVAYYDCGVHAFAVGMVIRNNCFHDLEYQAIFVKTNDVVIEYNEFYNCPTQGSDCSAVYFGRSPDILGTVIRYNYFHDIGNAVEGYGSFSIYMDDGTMGADVYGNLFVRSAGLPNDFWGNIPASIFLAGSQYSHIHNNIFADAPLAIRFYNKNGGLGSRQTEWFEELYMTPKLDRLLECEFDSDIWHDHYAGTIWAGLYDNITMEKIEQYSDQDIGAVSRSNAPFNTNELDNNVFAALDAVFDSKGLNVHDNAELPDTSLFVDYAGGNCRLTDAAFEIITSACPGFEPLPLGQIGPKE